MEVCTQMIPQTQTSFSSPLPLPMTARTWTQRNKYQPKKQHCRALSLSRHCELPHRHSLFALTDISFCTNTEFEETSVNAWFSHSLLPSLALHCFLLYLACQGISKLKCQLWSYLALLIQFDFQPMESIIRRKPAPFRLGLNQTFAGITN